MSENSLDLTPLGLTVCVVWGGRTSVVIKWAAFLVYVASFPSDFHNRVSTLYILKPLLEGLPWLFIG